MAYMRDLGFIGGSAALYNQAQAQAQLSTSALNQSIAPPPSGTSLVQGIMDVFTTGVSKPATPAARNMTLVPNATQMVTGPARGYSPPPPPAASSPSKMPYIIGGIAVLGIAALLLTRKKPAPVGV